MDINVVDETNYEGFVELLKKHTHFKISYFAKSMVSLFLEMVCGQKNVKSIRIEGL